MRWTSFAPLFRSLLADRGLSTAAFAAAVKSSKTVVVYAAQGRRAPPLDRLADWVHALQIPDQELVRRFTLLAYLAHVPPPLADAFLALEERADELERQVEALEARRRRPAQRRGLPGGRSAGRRSGRAGGQGRAT